MEYIKHAAIRSVNGLIIKGKSHSKCFKNMNKSFGEVESSGFLTSDNRYVNRKEGAVIAFKANQIRKEIKILSSEHLWCPTYQGEFNYCHENGYVKRGNLQEEIESILHPCNSTYKCSREKTAKRIIMKLQELNILNRE